MRMQLALAWALLCGPLVAVLLHRPGSAWAAMLAYHVGCIAATGHLGTGAGLERAGGVRAGGRSGRRGGTRPHSLQLVSLALVTAVAVVLGSAVAHSRVAGLGHAVESWSRWGVRPPGDLGLLLYYAAANPWIEERFWRGALLSSGVRQRFGDSTARALALFGFLPHHLAVLVPSFGFGLGSALVIGVLAASFLWTFLRLRSGGLWWSTSSHLGADAGLCAAYILWLRP